MSGGCEVVVEAEVYQRTPDDLISVAKRLASLSRAQLPEIGQGYLISRRLILFHLE